MKRDDALSRRMLVKMTGAAAATALVAGCADGGSDEDDPNGGGNGENDPGDNGTDDGTDDNETDGGGDDNETDDDGDPDVGEWEDVDEIVLEGYTEAWEGVEPSPIEGEENPTLVLFEGQEYDITWTNEDGQPHNIEVWDENEEVVDDYETETIDEEGEEQTLTIDEVTDEMTEYVCEVHIGTMRGAVQIESEGGDGAGGAGGEDNETDDGTDDNETGGGDDNMTGGGDDNMTGGGDDNETDE